MSESIAYNIAKDISKHLLNIIINLVITLAVVFILFYACTTSIIGFYNDKIENFSTDIKYTATYLIYTPSIKNTSWINTQNVNGKPQYVYKNIPDSATWNSIQRNLNAYNPSALVNYESETNPAHFPISYVGVCVDTYGLAKLNKNLNIANAITAPKGYFVAFTSPQNESRFTCSLDLQGKIIGYFGYTDEVFIDAVLNGHRIPMDSVKKVLINDETLPVLQFHLNNVDIFITYIIPGTDFHKTLLKHRITFMGFANMDIARVALFYPGLTMQNNINITNTLLDLPPPNNVSANTATVSKKENKTNLPTMNMTLLFMKPTLGVDTFTTEQFITRLDIPEAYLDPTYSCYGDINNTIKALCDSPYDIEGKPKQKHTTWDRPCTVNTDCPYFQANTNYPNTRGGCMDDGLCELPLGVSRVSYRQYNNSNIFAPFCYGCDAYDIGCCDKQVQPDYAFPNDTNDRIAANKELVTTIPLSLH